MGYSNLLPSYHFAEIFQKIIIFYNIPILSPGLSEGPSPIYINWIVKAGKANVHLVVNNVMITKIEKIKSLTIF